MWPFTKKKPVEAEVRSQPAGADYTALILDQLEAVAAGDARADPQAIAALEAAAGLVGRALAAAAVDPGNQRTEALTPSLLAQTGRSLIRDGECLFRIVVRGGTVRLSPVASWDVRGRDSDPSTWRYRCDLPAPDQTITLDLSADEILHFKWSYDPREPWRGISPVKAASLTFKAAGRLERAISDEANLPPSLVVPLPGNLDQLQDQQQLIDEGPDPAAQSQIPALKTLPGGGGARGKVVIAPNVPGVGTDLWMPDNSTGGGGRIFNPPWKAERLGPDYPTSTTGVRDGLVYGILAATGTPVELIRPSDGTAARESLRRWIHTCILPVGRILEEELSAKLGAAVKLNFDRVQAGDIQGRARAFQSMVGGGMDLARAAALSGLMIEE